MIWLKLAHIAAIALWSAVLVCLPGLYLRRARASGRDALSRSRDVARFLYVAVASPAAFVGIGSGTALIFMRETFEAWFSVKLALVGLLVVVHILTGLMIVRLFEESVGYPLWRFVAVTASTLLVVTAILAVVLAKPDLPQMLPASMSEPGALERFFDGLNPFPRS